MNNTTTLLARADHGTDCPLGTNRQVTESIRIYLLKCGIDQHDATTLSEQIVRTISSNNREGESNVRENIKEAIHEAILTLQQDTTSLSLPMAAPEPVHLPMRKSDPYRVSQRLRFCRWPRRSVSQQTLAQA